MEASLRRCSSGAPKNARFGAVAFLHRSGSSLNEHIHFHSAVTDGVFAPSSDGQAQFFEAIELTPDVIQSVQSRLRRRVLRYLERHGCLEPDTVEDMLSCPQTEKPCGFSEDDFVGSTRAGSPSTPR